MTILLLKFFSPIHYTARSINEMVLVRRDCISLIDDCQMNCGYSFTIGSIDGKHLVMNKPWKAGLQNHNYKGTDSIVLMANAMQTTCE